MTKLCYSVLFATASLKDTLEMKESSSPVNKRSSTKSVKVVASLKDTLEIKASSSFVSKSSSTGSVKEKVSIVAVHFIKMKNHYQNFFYSFLCVCYIID